MIAWTGDHWCVRDLGSRNGTFVNGDRLAPGERRAINAGVQLSFGVASAEWRLVSDAPPETPDGSSITASIRVHEDVGLRFLVSPDEETVEVTVSCQGRRVVLPERSYHYLLLTLARARLDDERSVRVDPREHGWRGADELARAMGTNQETLNVHIYRLRKQFEALALPGAPDLVERRAVARQVRIGVAALDVIAMRAHSS